ncbi:MAG: FKBP-type peptidyl-prolyl cis-trans isomerase [Candidatus Cryptobacteroides sp.]
MKTNKFIAAALVLAMTVACASNGGNTAASQAGADSLGTIKPVNPKSLLPSKAVRDSVSYLLGINFGSFLKGYNFGDDLNYAQIKKGINDFMKAKGDQRDTNFVKQFRISPERMNDLFNSFLAKRHDYTLALNSQKENKFLASNKSKDSVVVAESGLQYIIREAGNDVKAGPQDTIYVHYKGTLTDGTVFDQTQPEQPSARLIMDRVIKGWTEGLQLVGEGGKVKLFIPSALGYGENGSNGIEPNSVLVFDVQVDSVKHFVENPVKKK